jgi:hypothetical protein
MNNSPPDGSLKGLLLGARTELLQQLLLAGQRGGSTTLLQALRANLEGTLRQLDAAQILARIPSLNLPHLYLHIPFWGSLPGPPLTLEVRGRKRSPTEEMDEDNTDIEFSVKSRRWGLVHLRFAMRSGRTRGTIEAESPEARMFIEKKVGRLMESLRDIGYGVDQLSVLVARSVELGRPVLQVAGLGGYHLDMEV